MKAGEQSLQATLTAQQQYVIPIFQRYYAWDTRQWEELWADIEELNQKPGSHHFMGTLVFVAQATPVTYSFPVYQVIDGQQRIITFSILLAALRNVALKAGHKLLSDQITNECLIHPYKHKEERFRVFPRQRDRQDFINVVSGEGEVGSRIGKALEFFEDAIPEVTSKTEVESLTGFYNLLLRRLDFVHINLDGENPYKIFRSLNSTGEDLSPADLIRNLVFTSVPVDEQADFDEKYWKRLESRFTNGKSEINVKLVSSFFRDFLMTHGGVIAPADTFDAFDKAYRDASPIELAQKLIKAAVLYDHIRGSLPHPDTRINIGLTKLRQLDSSTSYPLILKLLGLNQDQQISADQLVETLEMISGFIFRRYTCGESSRAYAKWFVTACDNVDTTKVATSLEAYLTERGSFPDDARFVAALIKFPLYLSKYAFPVLQRLEESYGSKEAPSPDLATVEHIMPRTLTKEWREDLGLDARRIHDQWLDTIGNLTFTGYNSGLSNKRFSEKLAGVGNTVGYNKSNFELTKMFLPANKWSEEEIAARGSKLSERAAKIWAAPKLSSPEMGGIRQPINPFSDTGTRYRLFNILLDGMWHSIRDIQEQFRWDVANRVERLEKIGSRNGNWSIERDDDKVRMLWPGSDKMQRSV
jgi:hypothetical protein